MKRLFPRILSICSQSLQLGLVKSLLLPFLKNGSCYKAPFLPLLSTSVSLKGKAKSELSYVGGITLSSVSLQRAGSANPWAAAERIFCGINNLHLINSNKSTFSHVGYSLICETPEGRTTASMLCH